MRSTGKTPDGVLVQAAENLHLAKEQLRNLLAHAAGTAGQDDLMALVRCIGELDRLEDTLGGGRGLDTASPLAVSKSLGEATFPRFLRDEKCLVKIGWSKSAGREYE